MPFQAEATQHGWHTSSERLVFLGTPHPGAPLECLGNWVGTLLGSNVVTRPFIKIGQLRSAGITDLRYGHVLEADWQEAARSQPAARALAAGAGRLLIRSPTVMVCAWLPLRPALVGVESTCGC